MRQKLSDQELHALYCPLKNAKSALFLIASFSIVAFLSWKGLHRPPEERSLVGLFFAILVAALFTKVLITFSCLRDRLALGAIIVSIVIGVVADSVPAVFSKHAEMAKIGKLALSLLGLLVSLTMLVQSLRTARVEQTQPQSSIAQQPNRDFAIILATALVLLMLGALLYFLPPRQ